MDKIGDYIPLIIIAVSLIYSFVRKAGKNAAQEDANKTTLPNGLPKPNVPPKPQIKTRPQGKPVSQPVAERKQPEVSKSRWSTLETIPANVFSPDTKAKSSMKVNEEPILMNVEDVSDTTGIDLDFSNIDELKKGIVYAEIFNRRF